MTIRELEKKNGMPIQKDINRHERGFTLIEILVAMAIIAILAAIAIPRLTPYQERGIRAGMVADARNVATLLEAYFTDWGTYNTVDDGTVIGPGPATGAWAGGLTPKVSNNSTLTPTITATTYSIDIDNPGAGVGKSPLTLSSTGVCMYNDGSAC